MEEELVSFETAEIAKEKGFNELTVFAYTKKKEIAASFPTESYLGTLSRKDFESYGWFNNNLPWEDPTIHDTTYLFSAPSQSLLQRWLREKHNIHVSSTPVYNCNKKDDTPIFGGYVAYVGRNFENFTINSKLLGEYYKTYEEALEVGLQEALKLI